MEASAVSRTFEADRDGFERFSVQSDLGPPDE